MSNVDLTGSHTSSSLLAGSCRGEALQLETCA